MRTLPAILGVILLAGCGSAPDSHYYELSAVGGGAKAGVAARTVTLSDVAVPDMLDRPQIVLITGANTVQVREFDRWAEPFDSMVRRILAIDLDTRLGSGAGPATRRVSIAIDRFDADTSGAVVLSGRWTAHVPGSTDDAAYTHPFHFTDHADGGDLTSVAAGMSRLLGLLADELASAP